MRFLGKRTSRVIPNIVNLRSRDEFLLEQIGSHIATLWISAIRNYIWVLSKKNFNREVRDRLKELNLISFYPKKIRCTPK
jgi:hypothetical protein